MNSILTLALVLTSTVNAFIAPNGANMQITSRGSRYTVREATIDSRSKKSQPEPMYLNGWNPDPNEFAWGLPGSLQPVERFDPVGFTNAITLDEMKRYREAEITHGRVAMLATVGFLVAETWHPLFEAGEAELLGIYSLGYVRKIVPEFFEFLAVNIGIFETYRALRGWVNPAYRGSGRNEGDFLLEEYYPGDIGFDPLGLKPTDPEEFAEMQTKELQHGRLAMLAIGGFIAQEFINFKPVLESTFNIAPPL